MQTTITQGPLAELPVKEGDNAVLTCEIQHDPELELTVEWTVDDGTNERSIDWNIDNNRYKLGSDNSLTVIAVKKVDDGVYTCNAITTFSRDSASGKLIIQSKFINTATSSNVSKTVWYYYTMHKKHGLSSFALLNLYKTLVSPNIMYLGPLSKESFG